MNILHLTLFQQYYPNRENKVPIYINADKILMFRSMEQKRTLIDEQGRTITEKKESDLYAVVKYEKITCTEITFGIGTPEDSGTVLVNETCGEILICMPESL